MDINRYLERIKIEERKEPDLPFLERLMWHHLKTIPFENLDILRETPIILDLDRIYEKIVNRKRGGFCFELNGLFCRLLEELGFSVSMASARVYIPRKRRYSPEFDHITLLVDLNRTYLVDVGFGDAFFKPIWLPDGRIEDAGGRYRLSRSDPGGKEYLLEKQGKANWYPKYRFTTLSRDLSDFKDMCAFHQTSPEAPFTRGNLATIATAHGRVTLTDDSLTINEGGRRQKTTVASKKVFRKYLSEYFGIAL
jgi:N-hydroxyarylamine O-acetyltransferase